VVTRMRFERVISSSACCSGVNAMSINGIP
jgi:hypothetical protein